jgi:hypothetical protein
MPTIALPAWARDAGEGLTAGLPANRFHGPLQIRQATEAEAKGTKVLARAAVTVLIGGLIIAGISAAFSTNLFTADIRAAGLFIGLVMAGIGLISLVDPGGRKLVPGVIVIALAVVALPVALGGYLVGSLTAIVGGAMLVAYEPPTGPMMVQAEPAGYPRRALALITDFLVAFLLQRLLYALAGWFFVNTFNVLVSWVVVWVVAVVLPSILTRRTAGRILASTRVADLQGGNRSTATQAIIRESARGVIAIVTLFMVLGAVLQDSLLVWRGAAMVVVLGLLLALAEGFGLLDRIARSTSVHDRILPSPTSDAASPTPDTEAVAGSA